MTVLLTGATGALGRALVARLREEGRTCRVLTRRPYLAERLFAGGPEIVEWHPSVEAPPARSFEGVTAVLHLMGEPVVGACGAGRLGAYVASRALALERIADGMQGRSWRLIQTSICPTSDDPDGVLTETSPRPPATAELESAVLAAEASAQAARSRGASVVLVRLGLLLTPEGALAALARDTLAGRTVAIGGASIPVIAPDDAAAMMAGLIDRPDIEGPIHGVAPTPLDGRELMAALAALNGKRWPWGVPRSRRALLDRYGLVAPLLLNRARIVPQRLTEMGAAFAHPDPRRAAVMVLADVERRHAAEPVWWRRARAEMATWRGLPG